jgi:hypothetical protein
MCQNQISHSHGSTLAHLCLKFSLPAMLVYNVAKLTVGQRYEFDTMNIVWGFRTEVAGHRLLNSETFSNQPQNDIIHKECCY